MVRQHFKCEISVHGERPLKLVWKKRKAPDESVDIFAHPHACCIFLPLMHFIHLNSTNSQKYYDSSLFFSVSSSFLLLSVSSPWINCWFPYSSNCLPTNRAVVAVSCKVDLEGIRILCQKSRMAWASSLRQPGWCQRCHGYGITGVIYNSEPLFFTGTPQTHLNALSLSDR